jgi:hypothetical protein
MRKKNVNVERYKNSKNAAKNVKVMLIGVLRDE